MHERRFGLLDEETVFFEGLEGVLIEIIREQSFTRADGVRAVDDDDVVIVFGFPHEGDAVADFDGQFGILFKDGFRDFREIFLGQFDDLAIDVDHGDRFDFRMTDGFPGSAAVAAADDEDFLRVGMEEQGDVDDAFVIHKFIFDRRLENTVQDQHAAKFLGIGDDDVLELRVTAIEDIRHFRRQIQIRGLVFAYEFSHDRAPL